MEEVVPPLCALVMSLTLGDLILMVGEGQIDPPRMDVQLTPKDRAEEKKKKYQKLTTITSHL